VVILWIFFQFGRISSDVLKPKTIKSNRKIFHYGKYPQIIYKIKNHLAQQITIVFLCRTLAGNVGKCVCRLHPSNDRHFCLSPTCRKCRPDTSATFSCVAHFLAVGVVSARPVADTLSYMYIGISRVLVRG